MNAERLFELLIDPSTKFTQNETEEGWHFCTDLENWPQVKKNGLVAHPCLCFQSNCFQVDSGIIQKVSRIQHPL